MRPEDVEQVVAIEKRNFRDAWTRRAFLAEMASSPASQPLVAAYNHEIIGYVVPWYVADEMQIANLAIREDFRRRGLARKILEYICEVAWQKGCRTAYLEVRRSNLSARRLYENFGFKEASVRRDYYGPNEDALIMSKNLEKITTKTA
jgi:ribosomal-protein-alanine N-acetyltransferase